MSNNKKIELTPAQRSFLALQIAKKAQANPEFKKLVHQKIGEAKVRQNKE